MREPGDRRPGGTSSGAADDAHAGQIATPAARPSRGAALALALLAVGLAAMSWALLRGILDLGVGLIAVSVLGGWGIGAAVRRAYASPLLAATLAAAAWLLGLILTWLVAMAILPGSSRTFVERVEGTPFLEWLAPQFGLLEIAGLVIYVAVAGYVSLRGPAAGGT